MEAVRTVISNIALVGEEVKASDNLRDLGIDSLRMIQLVLKLEEKYGIEFQFADMNLDELLTVGDIEKLVKKYI